MGLFVFSFKFFFFYNYRGTNMWEALAHFERRVWRLLVEEKSFLPCRWMRHHVFFSPSTAHAVIVEWFVTDQPLFLFFSLSYTKNTGWSYLFLIFQLHSLLSWFLIFYLGAFVKGLFVFNLIILLLISNFFSSPFCKSFDGFFFHHSIQVYCILFFSNLILILLIFILSFC
jgi:hypothetical protein